MDEIFRKQKSFYETQQTKQRAFREQSLRKLQSAIDIYEKELYEAFWLDLHKSEFEVYATEIGIVKTSISNALNNMRRWLKPKRKATPLFLYRRKSVILREPYGTVLIMSPFNYPFQLLIEPLIGAIVAGNTAVLKPSELTPNVARVIETMIASVFPDSYIAVVQGGIEVNQTLLDLPFDMIFFTGSIAVGKIVMEKASRHLTPVVLELGGKSPAIIFKDAKLPLSIERLIWGKLLNSGQTCVAPDYVAVHESIYDESIAMMKEKIAEFYGRNPYESDDFTHIVNEKHAARLRDLIAENKDAVVYGGDSQGRYVEPTLFAIDSLESSLMQEEIFGPLLPVLKFSSFDELHTILQHTPDPLAFYIFTEDKDLQYDMMHQYRFGGGMVNDTLLHLANDNLPFGGVGTSGMGNYHGKASFEAFSHAKSIMVASTWINIRLLFPPYKTRVKWLRRFLK